MAEFDDILGGGDEPPRPKRGRPTNAERAERAERMIEQAAHQAELRAAVTGRTKIAEEEFLLPVSRNFLARVLHMDPMTVKKRLRGCKPAASFGGNAGRDVYYFHEALPFLVKPKMDLGTYIKTLNPADLPNSINKTFWEAERIKNKALIETGEAWHNSDVLEILGVVFMLFKNRLPLITEGMREAGLTDAQFSKLTGFVDKLQTDLHAALVDLPKQRRTLPRLAGIATGDGPEADGFYDPPEESDDGDDADAN